MKPAIQTVVGGVANVIPGFVRSWYMKRLTDKLAKTGA